MGHAWFKNIKYIELSELFVGVAQSLLALQGSCGLTLKGQIHSVLLH